MNSDSGTKKVVHSRKWVDIQIPAPVLALKDHVAGQIPMDATPTKPTAGPVPSRSTLAPAGTLLLAASVGLCAGYLDLVVLHLSKWCWHDDGYLRNASDSAWTVPVGHVVLLLVPAIVIAAVNWQALDGSRCAGIWLFASLALWAAMLRAPLYGVCSLILAIGLVRVIGDFVAVHGLNRRRLRFILPAIWGLLGVLAVLSTGWQMMNERRAAARLPVAPTDAHNVVFIVWDTVRTHNISSYGYFRDTTPNLTRWAKTGVQYNRAGAGAVDVPVAQLFLYR